MIKLRYLPDGEQINWAGVGNKLETFRKTDLWVSDKGKSGGLVKTDPVTFGLSNDFIFVSQSVIYF